MCDYWFSFSIWHGSSEYETGLDLLKNVEANYHVNTFLIRVFTVEWCICYSDLKFESKAINREAEGSSFPSDLIIRGRKGQIFSIQFCSDLPGKIGTDDGII